jgi:hypothetical protein
MRPARDDDANVSVRRRGLRDRDDRRSVDRRRQNGDRRRAAAGAEAGARMLAVVLGWGPVLV